MNRSVIIISLLFTVLFYFGCAVPQYIWPQKDIDFYEINSNTLEKKILVVSRDSEFKNRVIKSIQNAYLDKPVYIKIIGVESLKDENANHYTAVLILNTCMAWKIDRKVESFLDKSRELSSIIVLTTSGGGDILPDMRGREIDAMSSASDIATAEDVASIIIGKLGNILNNNK